MRKRTARAKHSGQLAGTRIKIIQVYNHGLRENVTLANAGTMPQPLGGWALVSLRGGRVYPFPDNLILLPEMQVEIHSGQDALGKPPLHLFWTDDQVWNNHGDVAVLFDPDGTEVDRYTYGQGWKQGRAVRHRKRLLRDGDKWNMVDEPVRPSERIKTRRQQSNQLRRLPR